MPDTVIDTLRIDAEWIQEKKVLLSVWSMENNIKVYYMNVEAGDEQCQITKDEFDSFFLQNDIVSVVTICARVIKNVIFIARISIGFREIDVSLSSSS